MKHTIPTTLIFIILLVFLVSCQQAAEATLPEPTSLPEPTATDRPLWSIVTEGRVQHPTTVVGFTNPDNGISIGPSGDIRTTTDGGEIWVNAENTSACRFGLEIVDAQIAWHCGNHGHVRKSVDGGQTWGEVSDFGPGEPNHCRFLSFIDEQTGWAATPYEIGSTTDGGLTWSNLNLPAGIGDIRAIDLRSPGHGYLLDSAGSLYITQDGGKVWETQALGLAQDQSLMEFPAPTATMRWLDADRGVVIASFVGDGASSLQAFTTKDGGQTWEAETLPADIGILFFTRNGQYLAIKHLDNRLTVLEHEQ